MNMKVESFTPLNSLHVRCDGTVPIVLRFNGYTGPLEFAPKYWRTGNFKNTLIEVGVNPTSGELCKIVLTLLPPRRSERAFTKSPPKTSGVPCVSLSQWKDDKERIDVEQEVIWTLVERELTIVFGSVETSILKGIVCDRMTFLIDQFQELSGFQVSNLSEQEVANFLIAVGDR